MSDPTPQSILRDIFEALDTAADSGGPPCPIRGAWDYQITGEYGTFGESAVREIEVLVPHIRNHMDRIIEQATTLRFLIKVERL